MTVTAPAKTTRRPRKAAAPIVQEAMVDIDDDRPRDHRGIPVVREELISSPLPTGGKFRISKLHLADGALAFACRDCQFTDDSRGAVQEHRNAEHGARFGHRTPKLIYDKTNRVLGDLVLPEREDGQQPPFDVMKMTISELLALMPSIGALVSYIDDLELANDTLKAEVREQRNEIRGNAHKVAGFDSLQEEVVDLRLKVRNVGSFDEMKTELLQLREFKKRTIARFKSLGFVLAEEEEQ
jgi:hypothetical protein